MMLYPSCRLRRRHRKRQLWAHMDKCSQGMQEANDSVHLLEKDNAMFGLYLEVSAGQEQESSMVRGEEKRRMDKISEAVDACTQLKLEVRARVNDGYVSLSPSGPPVVEEKRKVCRLPAAKKAVTRLPFARSAERAAVMLTREDKKVEKRFDAPEEHAFTARPLPKMYAQKQSLTAAGKRDDDADVATRTVRWYMKKQAKRVLEREEKRKAAEAALLPAPDLKWSAASWEAAKLESAQVADSQAAEKALREHAVAQRNAIKKARDIALLERLQAEHKQYQAQLQKSASKVRPRPDAPITRPTKAFQAATAAKLVETGQQQQQQQQQYHPNQFAEDVEDEDDDDPYRGIEPLRLDPQVLALIGEEVPPYSAEPIVDERPRPRIRRPRDAEEEARQEVQPEVRRAASPAPGFFFDAQSSTERGRKQCKDARLFEPSSMQRVAVEAGIVRLTGKLADPPYSNHTICVLFDRRRFTEIQAATWWEEKGRALCAGEDEEEASVAHAQTCAPSSAVR